MRTIHSTKVSVAGFLPALKYADQPSCKLQALRTGTKPLDTACLQPAAVAVIQQSRYTS